VAIEKQNACSVDQSCWPAVPPEGWRISGSVNQGAPISADIQSPNSQGEG